MSQLPLFICNLSLIILVIFSSLQFAYWIATYSSAQALKNPRTQPGSSPLNPIKWRQRPFTHSGLKTASRDPPQLSPRWLTGAGDRTRVSAILCLFPAGRVGGGWFGELCDSLLLLFFFFFFPPASFRLHSALSVGRSYGSQEEEAAEAVVLVSFVGLTWRPSVGVAS